MEYVLSLHELGTNYMQSIWSPPNIGRGATVSGVVVKIVLARWQERVRGEGAVLGCVVWAKTFKFIFVFDAKNYVFWVVKLMVEVRSFTHSYWDG